MIELIGESAFFELQIENKKLQIAPMSILCRKLLYCVERVKIYKEKSEMKSMKR